MKEFEGKIAVVTGAGSGIGAAIARRCAMEGMSVVLSDVDGEALFRVEETIRDAGGRGSTLSVVTDVSRSEEVERLAHAAYARFGAVHLLCNNAGVMHVAPLLEHTATDWEWVLGVNLFGVINGIRIFSPLMLAQSGDSHIVNVASTAAFTAGPGLAAYKVSKHAVLALSEVLYHEMAGQRVGVSVLCPGWVDTGIMDAERNRPAKLRNPDGAPPTDSDRNRQRGRESARAGMSPAVVAERLFDAIRAGHFYVTPDSSFHEKLRTRVNDVLETRNPALR